MKTSDFILQEEKSKLAIKNIKIGTENIYILPYYYLQQQSNVIFFLTKISNVIFGIREIGTTTRYFHAIYVHAV
jgi:hypothetical protein